MIYFIDVDSNEITSLSAGTTIAGEESPAILDEQIIQGGEVTDLDGTLPDINWRDGFALGNGVSAMTGDVLGSALKKEFDVKNDEINNIVRDTRYLTEQSDLEREISGSVTLKFNIGGFSLSNSSAYLEKLAVSNNTITVIAEYSKLWDSYDTLHREELSDTARKLLETPDEFRAAYGDYYIAGRKRAARFMAIYRCSSTDTSTLREFKSKLQSSYKDLLSTEGNTEFKNLAREKKVALEEKIVITGVPTAPPANKSILEVMQWFGECAEGESERTLLKHYSTLDPASPSRKLNISPRVFVDINQLREKMWRTAALCRGLPMSQRQRFMPRLQKLSDKLRSEHTRLIDDQDERAVLHKNFDELGRDMQIVADRYEFFLKVKEAVDGEPPSGRETEAKSSGPSEWLYGFDAWPRSEAVNIHSLPMEHHDDYRFAGRRTHSFKFNRGGKYLLVGWRVVSIWSDGTNGGWGKSTDRILLQSHGEVFVRSKVTRGFHWKVIYYFVDADLFQF